MIFSIHSAFDNYQIVILSKIPLQKSSKLGCSGEAKTKAGIIKNDYSQSMVETVEKARSRGKITDKQANKLKRHV